MNKISKEKKQQIVLILIGAIGVMGCLWYFAIQNQYTRLSTVQKRTLEMTDKVTQAESLLKKADTIEAELVKTRRHSEKSKTAWLPAISTFG